MVTIRDIKTICTAPEGINLLVVKVETSEPGLYGLGCGTFAYRHLAVKLVVEEYLRPLLIGRDVSDINDIWQLMHQNGYWRNGPIENNAISGVDMALWDIKGKMANMPLYQLFGGKCREGVPVYRHVDGRDLSEICENIAKYREIGVKTIRCQCGGYGGSEYGHTPAGAPVGAKPGVYLDGNAYIRDTVKLFDGIRSKMGDEIGLVHDVHERIAPADAVRLAKELEPYHLTFLEDPVSLEQVEYIRQIKNASSIPIAEGELFNNLRVPHPHHRAPDRLHPCAHHPGGRHHSRPQAANLCRAVRRAHRMAWSRRYVPAGSCSQRSHRPGCPELRRAGVVRH